MRIVREFMERNVVWFPVDMPVGRAADELSMRQIGGAPVCTPDGAIVGMLSKTDLVDVFGSAEDPRLVRDVMTPEILAIGADDPIESAVQLMAFEGVHRLIVRELDGSLAGIITSMDVLRALAGIPRAVPRIEAVAP